MLCWLGRLPSDHLTLPSPMISEACTAPPTVKAKLCWRRIFPVHCRLIYFRSASTELWRNHCVETVDGVKPSAPWCQLWHNITPLVTWKLHALTAIECTDNALENLFQRSEEEERTIAGEIDECILCIMMSHLLAVRKLSSLVGSPIPRMLPTVEMRVLSAILRATTFISIAHSDLEFALNLVPFIARFTYWNFRIYLERLPRGDGDIASLPTANFLARAYLSDLDSSWTIALTGDLLLWGCRLRWCRKKTRTPIR